MHNQKHTASITSQQDRLSYLWLALGFLLFAFSTPRWTIPLAAWIFPIFLLRFVRTRPLWRGILLVYLFSTLVLVFILQGVFPFSGMFYYLTVFGAEVFAILPYLLDRLLARRLGGLLGTLVFPLAVTTVGYLNALVSPLGTMGDLAYTQYGNLPLMQLVSVIGISGITFLMSWFASLVNWAWERGFSWPRVRGGVTLYASLFALVLLFGGARLALFPPQSRTVRVAGITPSQALIAAANKQVSQNMEALMSGTSLSQAQSEIIHQASVPVYDELLAQGLQEARAGAKIIVWHYQKAHPVPGEPFPPGDGQVPTIQTPYGLLSNVICFDDDFPGTLRQAGQAGADIMLVPSNDWREVDPYHTQTATFSAIENGYSLVIQSSHGLAMTVDYEGNALGASDYFNTDSQVMVAYVPMQGVHTIYTTIGDLFAWLCVTGLVVLIGVAIARRPKADKIVEAESSGEPLPVA